MAVRLSIWHDFWCGVKNGIIPLAAAAAAYLASKTAAISAAEVVFGVDADEDEVDEEEDEDDDDDDNGIWSCCWNLIIVVVILRVLRESKGLSINKQNLSKWVLSLEKRDLLSLFVRKKSLIIR